MNSAEKKRIAIFFILTVLLSLLSVFFLYSSKQKEKNERQSAERAVQQLTTEMDALTISKQDLESRLRNAEEDSKRSREEIEEMAKAQAGEIALREDRIHQLNNHLAVLSKDSQTAASQVYDLRKKNKALTKQLDQMASAKKEAETKSQELSQKVEDLVVEKKSTSLGTLVVRKR